MAASGLAACGNSEPETRGGAPSERVVKVIVQEITLGADTQEIEAVGTARARQAATIYPEANGEVVSVNFTAGQKVEKGQVLARLDDADQRLAVARAQVTLKDTEQLLNRYERIDVPEAVSDSQIDEARTAVEAAKIDLSLAREALAERTTRAPFSGYVGLSDIDPGARITTSTVITRLDDRSVLYVDFAVPEQVFGRIAKGDVLPMTPFSSDRSTVDAVVEAIDSRIDASMRSFMVRAAIDNTDDTLRPGMSFRINLALPGERYPKVPEAAIVWGGDGAYLWAVEDGAAKRVAVTIVFRDDGQVLVKAPLEEGDLIVAEGVQKMRPGLKVESLSRGVDDASSYVSAGVGGTGEALK
ncbi:MAG: efflux transporter periplasmic adaptor subunit [Hirschia sp.]|nr:efflux transporter periplasmic adaptor subunit [Hirschia sp.]MBF19785.1 efflux transporter periplasmic adaptor subunit [Hirschia sp.]